MRRCPSELRRSPPHPSPSPLQGLQWESLLSSARFSPAEHLRQLLGAAIAGGVLVGATDGVAALNSAMKAFAGGGSPQLAVALFDAMRRAGVAPDDYTFTFVLKGLARLRLSRRGVVLHSLTLKLGYGINPFVQNSLIHMYFACSEPATARRVFDFMPPSIRDVVSWNSMISGNVQSGWYREALHLFREMTRRRSSIPPDAATFVNALSACGRSGSATTGRWIHAATITRGFDLNFFLGSSLIDMYAKCRRAADARRVFDSMPEKNAVCWSSMISGYAHSGQFKVSIELFREMQIAGVKPEEATVSSVLSSCGQLGALCQGAWVHAFCDANGLGERLKVKNALIDMYSKCGEMEKALRIFQGMLHPDVFSWTALIGGLASNGLSAMAVDMFSQMETSCEVAPNGITFVAVLSACSHGGFVERAFRYFREMIVVHKICPKIQHYGCMVDLLGRAKLLAEMESFIRGMPIQPDEIIWRSLLFACRNCGNMELAEATAQRIVELDSQRGEDGARVMLSNMYASAARWKEVSSVREDMVELGIIKKPGCSSIEINGTVHEFFVRESTRHHQMVLIHESLLTLKELICSEGAAYL